MKYEAACHCGAVAAAVEAPETIVAHECNCSICRLGGYLHLIVPKSRFTLVRGEEHMTTYSFNSHVARHTFCSICGIKPFYVPRSNPDGYAVNVRCLTPQPPELTIEPFDGVNWEQHADRLRHLSRE